MAGKVAATTPAKLIKSSYVKSTIDNSIFYPSQA